MLLCERRERFSPGALPDRGEAAFEAALVADLRLAAATYSAGSRLTARIADARVHRRRFEELWAAGAAGAHGGDRKTIDRRLVGSITLDCDVLTVPGADLKIVTYTVATGTPDAEKLHLLRVAGLQAVKNAAEPLDPAKDATAAAR